MNNQRKIILSGGVAKRLLNRGHLLIDVKPKNDDPKGSAFLFFVDQWLLVDVDEIMQNATHNDAETLHKRLKSLDITEPEYRLTIFQEYLKSA